MKRLLVTLLVLTPALLSAQSSNSSAGSPVVINPQISFTLSKLSTDPPAAETKYRLGYQFGGYVRFGNHAYLQPGIFWRRMGVKLQTTSEIQNQHTFQNDVSTIQVPVLIGVNAINADKLVLRAFGGGVASFVTSVHDNPLYTSSDLRKTVLGARVGVGVDLFNLTGDLGWDWGLTKFFDDRVASDAKLNSVYFSLGLKL